MSVFSDALNEWGVESEALVRETFVFSCEEVERSIKYGSSLTGAPGQPVVTGELLASWIADESPATTHASVWEITTNKVYAPFVEDGANDRAFFDPSRQNGSLTNRRERSPVGGYHSVKLTEASFDRIADFAAQKALGHVVFS